MKRARPPGRTKLARRMRRAPTAAERAAWRTLRRFRVDGIHVRRQHPIGPYVVDFVVLAQKLVIELDGRVHELFGEGDDARDAWLEAEGYRVLRLPNDIAFDEVALTAAVEAALDSPSPRGGGG